MKRKLLTVLLALVSALCLCFGLAACVESNNGGNAGNENGSHIHSYNFENRCSICGKEWEYTKSDALEYTPVNLDGMDGYDVSFGEYVTYSGETGSETAIETVNGKPYTGEEVVFPYGHNGLPVISIGRFHPCTSDTVKRITVPKSITSFGQGMGFSAYGSVGAFQCPALEQLDLPDGLSVYTCQEIDRLMDNEVSYPLCEFSLFYGIEDTETTKVCPLYDDPQFRDEDGALYIGNYFFGTNCIEPADTFTVKEGTKVVLAGANAKHVILPDSVEIIAYLAFGHCRFLESIEIPGSVTEIGNWAFAGCSALTSITLPDLVNEIGSWAFDGCSGLTSVVIPDGVHLIRDSAFGGCSGLKSITLPDLVNEIGSWAFDGCSGLTSITIPGRVTEIDNCAFSDCSGLESVVWYAEKCTRTGGPTVRFLKVAQI